MKIRQNNSVDNKSTPGKIPFSRRSTHNTNEPTNELSNITMRRTQREYNFGHTHPLRRVFGISSQILVVVSLHLQGTATQACQTTWTTTTPQYNKWSWSRPIKFLDIFGSILTNQPLHPPQRDCVWDVHLMVHGKAPNIHLTRLPADGHQTASCLHMECWFQSQNGQQVHRYLWADNKSKFHCASFILKLQNGKNERQEEL